MRYLSPLLPPGEIFHSNASSKSWKLSFVKRSSRTAGFLTAFRQPSAIVHDVPGDEWRRFANVRSFLGYMYGHPGKKLLFMGQEFGQYEEWSEQRPLRWELLQFGLHAGLQSLVRDLNAIARKEPALYEVDHHFDGFQWIDFNDTENSVIAFIRYGEGKREPLVFVCNFTPIVRYDYFIGAPTAGTWREVLNTDAAKYGGSGILNSGALATEEIEAHGSPQRFRLVLPPLAVIVLKPDSPCTIERFDEAPLRR